MGFKIKRFLIGLLKIGSGLLASFFVFVNFYTIAEFILIDLGVNEEAWKYIIIGNLIPFLVFVITLIFWLKSKSFKNYIIIAVIFVLTYGVGKLFANKIAQPFYQANQLYLEAENSKNQWANETDCTLYLNGNRDYVDKYEKIITLNFGYEKWFKNYYNDRYLLGKNFLALQEKLCSTPMTIVERDGEVKRFNEENTELANRIDQAFLPVPFWMGYYSIELR